MLDLGYVQICVFIADCEYSLALVQHGLPVQARGWLRPWPGITCTQTTIQPNPLPSPFTDLPWTLWLSYCFQIYLVCWAPSVGWLFDTFSYLKLLECRFRLSAGVRMRGVDFSLFETSEVWFQSERLWARMTGDTLFRGGRRALGGLVVYCDKAKAQN